VEKGSHPYGMQTFEMHVRHLLSQGMIDRETAKETIGF
jgi:twitching motility protein PilT